MAERPGDRTWTRPYDGPGSEIGSESVRRFDLDVIDGPDKGARWESSGISGTIGTHASCDFNLTDPTVSRFHCEFVAASGGLTVRDLGSSNGTLLDGNRVIQAFPKTGSLIRLGRTVLQVC
jgi:pSer/pThr/pTyr-binding forkhead associated (FHA) protein